jgi:rhamnosyltransferase subunit B
MDQASLRTHIVVATIGSAGDLYPFLRMAIALRDAGHPVSFLAPAMHEPYVRQAGLAFTALEVDTAVLDDPDLWHARKGFGVVWRATRPAAAQLLPFVAALPPRQPCVLLVHPLALPEADLCRAARPDLRIAAAYLAPSNLPTVHDPLMMGPLRIAPWVPLAARRWLWRRIGMQMIDPVALPGLNAARAAHGLSPVRSLLDYLFAVPDLSIALFPEWFAATQPDWPRPLLRLGFPLYDPDPDPDPGAAPDPALERFLAGGAAPIVFTPGTGNRQAARYFQVALDASVKLGRRAIFLTPHAGQLPAHLPPAVLWQPYLPLRALLPRVAALVHHGGIGTTAEALRAGTPQLIVPLAHDQFDNAARVAALGAGGVLPAARPNAVRLRRSLELLLSSSATAARCRALAGQFPAAAGFDLLPAALAALAVPPR